MGKKTANLEIKILGDASSATRAFGDAERSSGGLMSKMGLVAGAAGAAVAGLAAIGKAAFDSASDLQQSQGAVEAVFGKTSDVIKAQAEDAQNAMGLSTAAYEQMASVLGSQLSNAGFAGADLTDTVYELQQKGADLAATFGGSTADAVSALSSVMKGETDPIEKYGISIKQSDITARLAAQGQDKLKGAALKNATAQAALGLVFDQSKQSVGAFAAEGDTAAGKQQRLAAMFENLKAKLGEGLLPIFVKAADFVMTKVVPVFEDLTRKGGPVSQMFATVGRFISTQVIPALRDLFKWAVTNIIPMWKDLGRLIVTVAVPAFQKIWALVQNFVIPIFKTVLGPALQGVRAAFHAVAEKVLENKDKFEKLYKAVQPVLAFLRDKVAPVVGTIIKGAFQVAGDAIGLVVDTVGWLVDKLAWIIDHGAAAAKWVGGLFSAADPAAVAPAPAPVGMFAAAPDLRAAAMFSAGGGSIGPGATAGGLSSGDTYVFNVSGLIGDKDDLAATIVKLLNGRAARTGARAAVVLA